MFPLIESIKVVDGVLQNIEYHQHRFEASYFKLYKRLTDILLENVIDIPQDYRQGLVKLRFLYNDTDCFCQYDRYKSKPVKSLKLVYDNHIDYSLKWVDRKKLNELHKQKDQADDILIIKNQRITDTSFTNIVFYDGKNWVTPKFPLLHGTARARLLATNKIMAEDIIVNDLKSFTSFKLINAMRDFDQADELPIHSIIL